MTFSCNNFMHDLQTGILQDGQRVFCSTQSLVLHLWSSGQHSIGVFCKWFKSFTAMPSRPPTLFTKCSMTSIIDVWLSKYFEIYGRAGFLKRRGLFTMKKNTADSSSSSSCSPSCFLLALIYSENIFEHLYLRGSHSDLFWKTSSNIRTSQLLTPDYRHFMKSMVCVNHRIIQY